MRVPGHYAGEEHARAHQGTWRHVATTHARGPSVLMTGVMCVVCVVHGVVLSVPLSPSSSTTLSFVRIGMCVCGMCVCTCVHVCVRACVHVCVLVCCRVAGKESWWQHPEGCVSTGEACEGHRVSFRVAASCVQSVYATRVCNLLPLKSLIPLWVGRLGMVLYHIPGVPRPQNALTQPATRRRRS
jgi:hypothetical protein